MFNIHAMMLDDDDFVDAIKEIINGQHKCAEYAVKTAGDNQAAVFAAMDDPYLQARSADVIDIAQAMLDILQGVDNATLQGTEPSILVAEDLALRDGPDGQEPAAGLHHPRGQLQQPHRHSGPQHEHPRPDPVQGDPGRLGRQDGRGGRLQRLRVCRPHPDLLESLTKRQQEDQKKLALLSELKGKPNTTLDGKTINVFANIGGISDVGAVQQNDAGGVGLFRTEFVYLNCKDFPPRTTSSKPTSR